MEAAGDPLRHVVQRTDVQDPRLWAYCTVGSQAACSPMRLSRLLGPRGGSSDVSHRPSGAIRSSADLQPYAQ